MYCFIIADLVQLSSSQHGEQPALHKTDALFEHTWFQYYILVLCHFLELKITF